MATFNTAHSIGDRVFIDGRKFERNDSDHDPGPVAVTVIGIGITETGDDTTIKYRVRTVSSPSTTYLVEESQIQASQGGLYREQAANLRKKADRLESLANQLER